jgi:hypothetical protein
VAYAEALRSFIVSERRKAFYLQKESEPGKKVKPLTVRRSRFADAMSDLCNAGLDIVAQPMPWDVPAVP